MFERRKLKAINLFLIAMESIKWELEALQDFMRESAGNLKRTQEELQKDYEKAKAQYGDDDDGMEFHFEDQFNRYHNNYPVFIFNSMLVSQFSFFELHLRRLCEMFEIRSSSKVKLSDLNGTDIEKCRKYLLLIAEINLDDLEDYWQKAKFFQKLRNVIIHHGNKVPNDQSYDNLLNHIKRETRITLDEDNREFVVDDLSVLEEFNELILRFFESITNKLSKTEVIAKNDHMPHNNGAWGREKSHNALESIAYILEALHFEQEKKALIPEELVTQLNLHLGMITYDLTKIYAFFSNAIWDTKDRDRIMTERLKGLEEVSKIYEVR